jgi:membrane-associated phospholipid phosphatase
MFLASTHLVSILATRHLKELTQRVRPFKWVKEVAKNPANDATFFEGGSAFPSGHGTLFCSMAIGLAVVFPRARVPLLGVVGFVMCARVGVNDHWASDVLASVTLVTVVAWLVGLVIRPLPLPARR